MKSTYPFILFICLFTLCLKSYGQCTFSIYSPDNDGDGYGRIATNTEVSALYADFYADSNNGMPVLHTYLYIGCNPPDGWVGLRTDLDDTNPLITDISPRTYYFDNDGDGYGTSFPTVFQSRPPDGYVNNSTDCNDNDPSVNEVQTWYLDADGDGVGGSISQESCDPPPNHVLSTGDECDNDARYQVELLFYPDQDGDGFGGPVGITACATPTAHVRNNLDRDDTNPCITDKTPVTYYEDMDEDGYGNPLVSKVCSFPPAGFVVNNTDCDDEDEDAFPGTVWYFDGDGDGYGASSPIIMQCTRPSGYVDNRADYDDSDENITNIAPRTFYRDADNDGYGNEDSALYQSYPPSGYVTNKDDCDDTDALLHNYTQWYLDWDGDGLGYNPSLEASTLLLYQGVVVAPTVLASSPIALSQRATESLILNSMGCEALTASYVLNANDFFDGSDAIASLQPQWWYQDADGDGFGTASPTFFESNPPPGFAANNQDCDDNNALLHPNTVWYQDADGDGFGGTNSLSNCIAPAGYVSNTLDYDDNNPAITNIAPQNYYQDLDKDGFGNASVVILSSSQPPGYVTNDQDCEDNDASLHPNTVWYLDADGDSYGTRSTAATATTQQCTSPLGFVSNNQDYDDSTDKITHIAPQSFYRDADGDGYGNPNDSVYYSVRPDGYVTNNLDCDDTDPLTSPQTIWYEDIDGDGLGNPKVTTTSCTTPTNYVSNNGDLNDDNQYITDIATRTFYFDADGDGFGDPDTIGEFSLLPPDYSINNEDCNDADASINPNTVWYLDADGDGYGSTASLTICSPPKGYLRNSSDLDDSNALITNLPPQPFYRDKDQDGFGDPSEALLASLLPSGYVINAEDCNDLDASLNPNTQWYADEDNDGFGGAADYIGCDPPGNQVRQSDDFDDSTPNIINIAPNHFYLDKDGDGYGNPNSSVFYSLQPVGYVHDNQDCDDQNARINPNTVWYRDQDGDGYGNARQQLQQCMRPLGYVNNPYDREDDNPNITNILPQHFYRDRDDDGYGVNSDFLRQSYLPHGYSVEGGDCDDDNPLLHPATHWYPDTDQDGFGTPPAVLSCIAPSGHVTNALDLNDQSAFITDRASQTFYLDEDGDGFGQTATGAMYSYPPPKHVVTPGDCDDQNQYVHAQTQWFYDGDGDGFGSPNQSIVACEPPEKYFRYSLMVGNRESAQLFNTGFLRDVFVQNKIHFLGPVVTYRKLSYDLKFSYEISYSFGFTSYLRFNSVENSNIKYTANTHGNELGLAIYYQLTKHLALGGYTGLNIGSFKKYRVQSPEGVFHERFEDDGKYFLDRGYYGLSLRIKK